MVLDVRKIHGVILGNAVPQLAVPKLVENFDAGKCPFNKLLTFYRFDKINEAAAESAKGETKNPVIIIDENYLKDEPIEYKNQ